MGLANRGGREMRVPIEPVEETAGDKQACCQCPRLALQAGQTYWVEIEPSASDTFVFWYTNSQNVSGGMTNIGGAGWVGLGGSSSMPAFSVSGLTFQVTQKITFLPLSNVTIGVAPFTIPASSSSGLAVSFVSTTPSVCTVSGNSVTIVGTGSCSTTASQAGNANYAAAVPVTQFFTVMPNSSPAIQLGGIVPVGSAASVIQPGEWVSIFGTNLAATTANWSGDFPTSLGKPAYLSFVSPGQINLQAPDDTTTGSVPVLVKTANGSAAASVTMAQFAPSFFLLDGKHRS